MDKLEFIEDYKKNNIIGDTVTRKDFLEYAEKIGVKPGIASAAIATLPKERHGHYKLGDAKEADIIVVDTSKTLDVQTNNKVAVESDIVTIPDGIKEYVSWGNSADVRKIISSGAFFPTFIFGLSGNGKTMMVEQSCASEKRGYVRIQITPETDEDDLIGGFRLKNGETVFSKGPVIRAMESGAILLIDEIDRGSNNLMAIQGVLEGKPVLIKKTGELVTPKPGFNIFATANTKGQGDDTGKFISSTIIDDAFLERFVITMDQPYPSDSVETKILNKHMEKYGVEDDGFVKNLVSWAQGVRKTYDDGGIDDVITTRRLCHIVQTYSIFETRKKAVELCLNRFDSDTRTALLDLYMKIDAVASGENKKKQTPDYGNHNPF